MRGNATLNRRNPMRYTLHLHYPEITVNGIGEEDGSGPAVPGWLEERAGR